MAISNWPTLERPREKLLNHGSHALSDAELLAIFFRTGTKGKSAVDLAREALTELGGLRQLLMSPQVNFCKINGLGSSKYVQLQASIELGRRYLQHQLTRYGVLHSPEDTKNFLVSKLRDKKQEVFACLFLDNKHRVIAFEELFFGTIDSAMVHPRIIITRALHHNAAAVILSHNHPSGSAIPSNCDIAITHKIVAALKLIDIRVLDHIVIGDGETTSLAESGVLH